MINRIIFLSIRKNYTVGKDGAHRWCCEGKLHREDGPAILYRNTLEWYREGYLHREDGPAIISYGIESWYYMGKLHRDDNPAVIWPDGYKEWWCNGELCGHGYFYGNFFMRRTNDK